MLNCHLYSSNTQTGERKKDPYNEEDKKQVMSWLVSMVEPLWVKPLECFRFWHNN